MEKQLAVLGRRKFLLASGTLALVGTIGNTRVHAETFSEGATRFTKCTSLSNTCFKYSVRSNNEPFSDLAVAARRSVAAAKACIRHLNSGLAMSDHDLQDGLELAGAVVAGCGAVALLATSQSRYLTEFAPSTVELCKACQNYCNKLKDHQTCVDCAKACLDFIGTWYQVTEVIEYDL